MAHGDPINNSGVNNWSRKKGTRVEKYLLLDGASSGSGDDATGAWVNVAGVDQAVVSIISTNTTTGATIQVRGHLSADGTAPAAANDGFQVGSDAVISSDTETDFAILAGGQTLEYVKAIVSSYTDGDYDVVLEVTY